MKESTVSRERERERERIIKEKVNVSGHEVFKLQKLVLY